MLVINIKQGRCTASDMGEDAQKTAPIGSKICSCKNELVGQNCHMRKALKKMHRKVRKGVQQPRSTPEPCTACANHSTHVNVTKIRNYYVITLLHVIIAVPVQGCLWCRFYVSYFHTFIQSYFLHNRIYGAKNRIYGAKNRIYGAKSFWAWRWQHSRNALNNSALQAFHRREFAAL